MKQFYGYFFCNRFLIKEYLEWADENKMKFDIFTLLKANPIPAWGGHHLNDTEYCMLIRESGTYFNRKLEFDNYRKTFTQKCVKRIHPAEKPVEFLERFIRVSCPENGTVLDPFMGSGSTGVAALLAMRKTRSILSFQRNALERSATHRRCALIFSKYKKYTLA